MLIEEMLDTVEELLLQSSVQALIVVQDRG